MDVVDDGRYEYVKVKCLERYMRSQVRILVTRQLKGYGLVHYEELVKDSVGHEYLDAVSSAHHTR